MKVLISILTIVLAMPALSTVPATKASIEFKVSSSGRRCEGWSGDRLLDDNYDPTLCGKVEEYLLVDGGCIGFDKNGKPLGIDLDGYSNCSHDKPREYKVSSSGRRCEGWSGDRLLDDNYDPTLCGKVEEYLLVDGGCIGFDKNGKPLGSKSRLGGYSNCSHDKPREYKVSSSGRRCEGWSGDRLLDDDYDPTNCGEVAYYLRDGSVCIGYDKNGKSLGIDFNGYGNCEKPQIFRFVANSYCISVDMRTSEMVNSKLDPEACGFVARYEETDEGCMGYGIEGEKLGLIDGEEGERRCLAFQQKLARIRGLRGSRFLSKESQVGFSRARSMATSSSAKAN